MGNEYVGDDGSPVIYNIPRPVTQNPGPPSRGSYTGQRNAAGGYTSPPPKPPPDMFGGYLGPAIDAAKQLVQQFLTLMGFSAGLDANQLTLQLLQAGVAGNTQQAMDLLFYNGKGVSDTMRDQHKWAQLGLDATTWQNRVDSLDQIFQGLTGQASEQLSKDSGGDLNRLYYQALQSNWSQGEVLQHLQNDAQFAQLRTDQPWLSQGQGEQQAANSFASLYGSAPVDTATLASWFRFNTGTVGLNRSGREATMTAAPIPESSATR